MEEVLKRLVTEIEQRRYGKYRGTVKDNEDPKKLGRLQVTVPTLFGKEQTTWAMPCVPFGGLKQQGMFFIPENESRVWIEFEEGDINRPIWTGVFWDREGDAPDGTVTKTPAAGESPRGGKLPASGSKEDQPAGNPPNTRILQTPSGHQLRFDDAEGERRITLTHASDSALTLEEDGSVELVNSGGMILKLSQERSEVLLEDARGNQLRMDDRGWTAQDNAGNRIEMSQGTTTVSAGSSVTIDAPSVSIGGFMGEPVIKGLSFLTKYMTHTHTVAPIVGGPTSPPIPQGEMDTLSKKVRST